VWRPSPTIELNGWEQELESELQKVGGWVFYNGMAEGVRAAIVWRYLKSMDMFLGLVNDAIHKQVKEPGEQRTPLHSKWEVSVLVDLLIVVETAKRAVEVRFDIMSEQLVSVRAFELKS
jgi:hypothetical protein